MTRASRRASVDDLQAVADHARQRASLYRRRVLLGRGEPRRLAELERIAAGAAGRVKEAVGAQRRPQPAGATLDPDQRGSAPS